LQPAFAPEKITDYEAGLRASLFDRRLQVNLAGFYYDCSNIQVSKTNNTMITTENAASAKLYGMEAELTATPVDRLTVQANLSLLHTEYKDYQPSDPSRLPLGELDLSGNHFNQAPNYTINVSAAYTIPTEMGEFELRGEGRWVDKVYFTQFNMEHLSQSSH